MDETSNKCRSAPGKKDNPISCSKPTIARAAAQRTKIDRKNHGTGLQGQGGLGGY